MSCKEVTIHLNQKQKGFHRIIPILTVTINDIEDEDEEGDYLWLLGFYQMMSRVTTP